MRLIHVSPSEGRRCGIALFAHSLAGAIAADGLPGEVLPAPPSGLGAGEVVLVHHHPELLTVDQLAVIREKIGDASLAVFAHERLREEEARLADGIIAPYAEMVPNGHDALAVGHPVPVPERLRPRGELRSRFGLPQDRFIIGTSGFLRLEREFDRVLDRILPAARRHGWFILFSISPWHTPSPGVLERLEAAERAWPEVVRVDCRLLSDEELNSRLQACDVLWCWTAATSRPYGSGVASTLYASGTRLVLVRKRQHEQVLRLPNVVAALPDLDAFTAILEEEARNCRNMRHTPEAVSWSHVAPSLSRYLLSIDRARTR